MQIIYARQEIETDTDSLFLAGPTPRKEHPYPSWRPQALQFLQDRRYKGTVLVPEDEELSCDVKVRIPCELKTDDDYLAQVEWEHLALTSARVILFWIPRKLPEMPGFTTNDEWGCWKGSGKVVLGIPPEAVKVSYQKYYAKKHNIPMATSLEGTIELALGKIRVNYPSSLSGNMDSRKPA